MNKEQWLQITTKVYQEYGFVKKGRFFYLDLEDVLICSKLAQIYGVNYLAYNFSVKAVHSPKERKSTNMYDGYDGMENIIYFDPNAWGINKRAIWYEKWTEKYYTAKLKELLHYYIDPYKQDALGHIKRCYFEIGLVHKDEIIEVSGVAKEFLGLPYSVDYMEQWTRKKKEAILKQFKEKRNVSQEALENLDVLLSNFTKEVRAHPKDSLQLEESFKTVILALNTWNSLHKCIKDEDSKIILEYINEMFRAVAGLLRNRSHENILEMIDTLPKW